MPFPTEFSPLDERREDLLRESMLSAGISGASDEEEAGSVRSFLVFLSGSEWFAADLAYIRRVLRPAAIARVSGAAPEVLGLMNYQGEVLCVLELRRILGGEASGETAADDKFIVVLHYGGREAGFLVDSVEDVWELPRSAVLPVLESLDPSRARMFEGTVTNGGRFAGLLSPSMCLNP
jgi:purine-binding chemotaxis protein CheW